MSRYSTYQRSSEEPIWGRTGYDGAPQSPHILPSRPFPSYAPQTTIVRTATKPPTESDIYKVGVYGWRKRCLYCFICALTVVVVLNLALTIWIMTVLDFSSDGMGALKISDDSVRVVGQAQFDRPVHFSELSTADVCSVYSFIH
ncbi:hypothetical protein AB6A40_010007 [Gnathostoma spinigerum]|uniref:Uncharacterized protein n=1 Tax=Gnathostoma spinigerum TaxID=75299 RepID=A0ABD6EU05_9BILA